jgi:hypothetical protein
MQLCASSRQFRLQRGLELGGYSQGVALLSEALEGCVCPFTEEGIGVV